MMEGKIKNPYGVTIEDVTIKKFSGAYPMSIFPQFVEFVLYQSIFSPTLKAQLVLHDGINLLNNYPLMGEETVEVFLRQEGARYSTEAMNVKLTFIIAGIHNIEPNLSGREQTYIIELHSIEAFENAKRKISKAYKTSLIERYINEILVQELKSTKLLKFYDSTNESQINRVLVVPNLKPFSAITWLARMAVPINTNEYHNYNFFETLYGTSSRFNFKAFQKQVWQDSVDAAAFSGAQNHPYFFISNYEIIKSSPSALQSLQREGFAEERLILNFKINKRYSTLEKIIGGYFENEYVEISLDQKDHRITKTKVSDQWKSLYYQNYLQTQSYINNIINTSEDRESSARVKYVLFNYNDAEQDPRFNTKWGKQEISKTATGQIDISLDVNTNLKVVPGDLIYLNIPEMHGFEESKNDRYLTGHFYITENKMIIRSSGETSMLLRVNKDSYFTPINLNSGYNLE